MSFLATTIAFSIKLLVGVPLVGVAVVPIVLRVAVGAVVALRVVALIVSIALVRNWLGLVELSLEVELRLSTKLSHLVDFV